MIHPLFQETYNAVVKLIGDTSVPAETTLEALEELSSLIEAQMAALREELED